MNRTAALHRKTNETEIHMKLSLEGGRREIATGIGFFDHMLHALAVHGGLGLELTVRGDLEVDCHHTVEDVGIVLGQALGQVLADKTGLRRYGHTFIPMDEALAFCALDISGRPFLVFEGEFPQAAAGGFDCCMTEEFFRAVAINAGLTVHLRCEYGKNSHHMIEAMFKAFAHALKDAAEVAGGAVLSSKGVL